MVIDGSVGEAPCAAPTSDGSDVDRPRRTRSSKTTPQDEILSLRDDARALERLLLRLQRERRSARSQPAGKWKRLAYEQSEQRADAVHENKKLRLAMAESRQLATSLMQLVRQPTPRTQELGSVEENEWRMNQLGHHPRRRHLNADRIMDQLYRKLPSWAITSGLVDVGANARFSRCENKGRVDQAMHLEVNFGRQVRGHYVDVAAAVWRYFSREDLETGAAAMVRVETSEILGDRIRHNTTGLRMTVDGEDVDHTTHQLCRRIEDASRIVIMWKAVTEDMRGASHRFTDNADGWISFEKAVDDDLDTEKCLIKCSSMVLVLPLMQVGACSGAYLLRLVRMMNLPLGIPSPASSASSSAASSPSSDDETTAERARLAFADFLLETLWRHASRIERLAASVGGTAHTTQYPPM